MHRFLGRSGTLKQTEDERIRRWMEQAVANLSGHSEETLEYCSRIFSYVEADDKPVGEDYDMYLGFAHYYSGEAYYTLNNVEKVLFH